MSSSLINSQQTLTVVDFDPFAEGELSTTAPATEAQKEIWASVKMGDAANCAYNESQSLRLRGSLDVETLQFALQELVQRHEALRMTFSPDGNTLCIAASRQISISWVDLSDLHQQERETEVAVLSRQQVEQPFDLEHGPLFRVQIVKLQSQEHLLLLTAHHIVCDGWSWGVLISDLGKIYSARRLGVEPNLEEPDRFSDYALLQDEAKNSMDGIATEAYWLEQFSDSVPIVDFPSDRPRPPVRTFNAAREDWNINSTLVTEFKQLGTKLGCSFMTIILASFEVWLYRLTNQEDIVVGIAAAGQVVQGQYNLIGHCVNLLPLRSHITGEQPFSNYLRARNSAFLEAYEHQQFTFGSLVKKLKLSRDSSIIPLVPITFNIDRGLAGDSLPFEGLELEFFSNPRSFENFELFINATELHGKLILECQYNTNLFDADTIRRRMAEFETLLAGIVADPNQCIAKLPILPEAERQLLAEWNRTQTAYHRDKCIHQLFEAQAEQTPEAVAVSFADKQLTYRELNNRSNQLARYLKTLGVGPDVLVGICIERSWEMVVGLLGILKAGGAYVPLDPTYPQERLNWILGDAQVSLLLTQKRLAQVLKLQVPQIVCLDWELDTIAQQNQENLDSNVTANHLVYVIYTSGSTGKPKGVPVEHGSLLNLVFWHQQAFEVSPSDRTTQIASSAFDACGWEIWPYLTAGASLHFPDEITRTSPTQLQDWLLAQEITISFLPTPLAERVLTLDWSKDTALRTLLTGGDKLQQFPPGSLPFSVVNNYGPTENTVVTTSGLVTARGQAAGIPTIGRPIANTQVYLLDTQLQPVPIGTIGELYVSGDGLARGYLNQPRLTADCFIPHPFSSKLGARLYKTGDLARYQPDGNIEFLGRMDEQVKIRGFRIELGEIETVLGQHSCVQKTVVLVREDEPGDKRLVAYVVLHQEQVLRSAELRSYLKAKLPDYMVPATFVLLSAMPLTPNGKVDRNALPVPNIARPELEELYVAPRTTLEQQIAEIWAQVLHLEHVGIYDNFFELGGYSLLAIQIGSRLRKALQVEIPLPSLFETPTVATLAQRIETVQWAMQEVWVPEPNAAGEYEEGEV